MSGDSFRKDGFLNFGRKLTTNAQIHRSAIIDALNAQMRGKTQNGLAAAANAFWKNNQKQVEALAHLLAKEDAAMLKNPSEDTGPWEKDKPIGATEVQQYLRKGYIKHTYARAAILLALGFESEEALKNASAPRKTFSTAALPEEDGQNAEALNKTSIKGAGKATGEQVLIGAAARRHRLAQGKQQKELLQEVKSVIAHATKKERSIITQIARRLLAKDRERFGAFGWSLGEEGLAQWEDTSIGVARLSNYESTGYLKDVRCRAVIIYLLGGGKWKSEEEMVAAAKKLPEQPTTASSNLKPTQQFHYERDVIAALQAAMAAAGLNQPKLIKHAQEISRDIKPHMVMNFCRSGNMKSHEQRDIILKALLKACGYDDAQLAMPGEELERILIADTQKNIAAAKVREQEVKQQLLEKSVVAHVLQETVAAALKRKGWDRSQLAQFAGVSYENIRRIAECRSVEKAHLEKILTALDIDSETIKSQAEEIMARRQSYVERIASEKNNGNNGHGLPHL